MKLITVAIFVAVLVLLAGCGSDKKDEKATPTPTATETQQAPPAAGAAKLRAMVAKISKNLKTKPTISIPKGSPPTKLFAADVVRGRGKSARAGSKVSVQYVGVAASTGKEFDASWNRGEPFEFDLGAGSVIPGWDQGVVGMKRGGRRLLVIPPDLGYGAQGQPAAGIGPNETLVFVVDLVK